MPTFNPFRRSGTKSRFGQKPDDKRNKERTLPVAQEPESDIESPQEDRKKKEDEANDAVLDNAAGKENESETKDTKATKPTGKKSVFGNVKKDRQSVATSSRAGGSLRSYQRIWAEVSDYTMHPIKFGTNAYFIPNGMALHKMLEIAIPLVARTNWIQKQNGEFNPYAVAFGYFYMYYIQILRAKSSASDLAGQESSALTRFTKYNPLETIPVPDFMVPFFESIIATEMEDTKYSWIIPTWGYPQGTPEADWPNYAGLQSMEVSEADYLRPNIPFMLANLATFGAEENITGLYNHMDSARTFTPVSFIDNSDPTTPVRHNRVQFMNQSNNMTSTTQRHTTSILTTLGASFPFQFWNDNYAEAQRYIGESNFFVRNGINIAATNRTPYHATTRTPFTNPVTGRAMTETVPLTKIDNYLFIAKENNPIWFSYIKEQMTIFAKHFPTDLKTFADIATTGGMESTIVGQMKFEDPLTAGGTDYVYPDQYCGETQNTLRYYPKLFRTITGSFATTRNDTERNEVLQAFAIAINSNPPMPIDATRPLRNGKFFTQSLTDRTVIQQIIGRMEQTAPGEIPLFNNWTDYIRDAFVNKPE